MITTLSGKARQVHANAQRWQGTRRLILLFLAVSGVSALIGLLMLRRGPNPALIGWVIYFCCIAAIFYRPRYGIYLMVGLALAGDSELTRWYPFVKNLSSYESLFYIGNGLSFSPLEITLVLTTIAWLVPAWGARRIPLYLGPLFWPAIAFAFFITTGFFYGVANGGDTVIALWAVRGLYILPLALVLTSNLIVTRDHIRSLMWWAVAGIFADAVAGVIHVATVLQFDYTKVQAIAEHSYSIHINSVFVLMIAVWIYRGTVAQRAILPLMLPVLGYAYLANQRRAAFIALAAVAILAAIMLYWENRKLFLRVVPIVALLTTVYVVAFWNGGGGAFGAPAYKLRMAIAPPPGSEEESSNVYRTLENINTMFTIKTSPIMGVGFGNKFYRIVELPDISFFIWYEYFTHNSILWLWMQAGIGGFLAFLYLIGKTMLVGAQRLLMMPGEALSAIVFTALAFVLMYVIYAYVDMAYDAQSMMYLGALMGVINAADRIAARPVPVPPLRWPWQRPPKPVPGLRSL